MLVFCGIIEISFEIRINTLNLYLYFFTYILILFVFQIKFQENYLKIEAHLQKSIKFKFYKQKIIIDKFYSVSKKFIWYIRYRFICQLFSLHVYSFLLN